VSSKFEEEKNPPISKWVNVDEGLPKVGQRVEYYFSTSDTFVIQSKGTFEGFYADENGKEYPDMHIFVSDDRTGWLTGDVQKWREI